MPYSKNIRHIVQFGRSNKILMAVFVSAITTLVAFAALTSQMPATAAEGTSNDIIKGGVTSAADFANKVKANSSGDLDDIYKLNSARLKYFEENAVRGTVHKDGRVVVNNKVVGTNAWSLGREYLPGSTKKVINDTTYYWRSTSISFAQESLEALVVLDKNGKAEAAIIMACGNPVGFDQPKTTVTADALCKALVPTQVDRDSYTFHTTLPVVGDAKLKTVVYSFSDGTASVTKTSGATLVPHTFAKPGTYTIKATATFTVAGKTETKSCTAKITVNPATTTPTPTPPTPTPTPITVNVPAPTVTLTSAPAPAKTELPATGAADAFGALGFGSLAGVGYYWNSSRRNLIARLLRKRQ